VTGWGEGLDELAGATAALLQAGPVAEPMVDVRAAMACRDAVLTQVRELVGSVSDVPRLAVGSELTVFDLVHRPGQALHQALAELPRAVPFGTRQHTAALDKTLPVLEQHWQVAARAATGLERYITAAGQLPDQHAWYVLRDLADIAAALPALDHALSEALLPGLPTGQDLATPYAMLTHPGHDAVRLAAGEIQARVPADGPRPAAATANAQVLAGAPAVAGELSRMMFGYVQGVSALGGKLSVGDMRAVTRLLECGGADAARVLARTAPTVAGAADLAEGLRQVSPLASQLRTTPTRSISTEHLRLLRDSRELQARMRALAVQALRLPPDAADRQLRRLAPPALAFAEHIPMLTRALELSVRESLAQGLLLVPSLADHRNTHHLMWVTDTMRPGCDGPPAVQRSASELARAAEQIGPPVRTANHDLARHAATGDPSTRAAKTARRQVGKARAELRTALTARLDQPPALSASLTSHPRLAPAPNVSNVRY
jgi:hypothetical protein